MTEIPAGDDRSAHIYATFGPGVFATCLSLLRNRDDAADATQEVFARALPSLDGVRNPSAWLQLAARHHCLDLMRRRRRAERCAVPDWGGLRGAPDPAEVVEQRDGIEAAMATLSERDRCVLAHVALRDATTGEVASRLRVSHGAALQIISRARRRAAQAWNLPSTVAVPRLPPLAELLRRLPAHLGPSGAAGALPRSAVAGVAAALCASLLCSSGPGARPQNPAGHPGRASASVAPARWGSAQPVAAAATLVPPSLTRHPALGRVPSGVLPLRGSRGCSAPSAALAANPTVMWTDPAGDQSVPAGQLAAGPQTDIVEGDISTRAVAGVDVLVARIQVVDMSLAPPPGFTGMRWNMLFEGQRGNDWVYAESDSAGRVTYASQLGGAQPVAATGTVVPGANGYVEIDVPLTDLGRSRGSVLVDVLGSTELEELNGPDAARIGVDDAGSFLTPVDYLSKAAC